jgi:hypothetical protein
MKNREDEILLQTLFELTQVRWEWYWGDKLLLGCEGTWQLMPVCEQTCDGFWDWYLYSQRQWFDNKHEAVTALIGNWFYYQKREVGKSETSNIEEDEE